MASPSIDDIRKMLVDDVRTYHEGLLSRYRDLVAQAARGSTIVGSVHDAIEAINRMSEDELNKLRLLFDDDIHAPGDNDHDVF
jgi:hypothetical protein